jgi:hypothetical protein
MNASLEKLNTFAKELGAQNLDLGLLEICGDDGHKVRFFKVSRRGNKLQYCLGTTLREAKQSLRELLNHGMAREDEQPEILGSIAISMCEAHGIGSFYKLPTGEEVEYEVVKTWLLTRGIDIESEEWTWWMDFCDAYAHCEEEVPKCPDQDMTDEDFNAALDDMFDPRAEFEQILSERRKN